MAKIIHLDSERTYRTLLDLCVELNMSFYKMAQRGAMVYRADHTRREVEYTIGRVRKEKPRRKKIRRIAERFPHEWPLHDQAAYLLRAFSGLQIFPDANHRTGLAITREHLHDHREHFDLQGPALAEFISNLRSLKGPYSTRCNAGDLQNRDEPLKYIARTISDHSRRFTVRETLARAITRVPGIANVPGSPPLITPYAAEDVDDERRRKGTKR